MRQIIQDADGTTVRIQEIADPAILPGHALVAVRASLLSHEIVRAGITGAASGTIETVGAGLERRFRVGQRVAFARPPDVLDSDLALVPTDSLAPVPDDINDEEACFGALAAIVLEAVHRLDVRLGDVVAVAGLGLCGLIAAEILELSGIRVVAIDDDLDRLELARYGRAALTWDAASGSPADAVASLTVGRGCDGLMLSRAVRPAEELALLVRPGGRVCLLDGRGDTLATGDLALLMERGRGLTAIGGPGPSVAGWSPRRWLEEAVHRMTRERDHRLAVEHFITHRFANEHAAEAAGLLHEDREPALAVILQTPDAERPRRPRFRAPHMAPGEAIAAGKCRIAVIGPVGIAERLARIDAFVPAPGPDTADAVVVATGGSDQSEPVIAALKAGKPVLVLGTLADTVEAHDAVVRARRRSDGFLVAGHPGRFAPSCRLMRDHMAAAGVPLNAMIRLVADENGTAQGIDLARFLVGHPIAAVRAAHVSGAAGSDGGGWVSLDFSDGSLATIIRVPGASATSLPNTSLIEIFAAGRHARMEDFGRPELIRDGERVSVDVAETIDDGLDAMLAAFVEAVRAGGPSLLDESELFEVGNAAVAAGEAARTGRIIYL